MKRIIWVIVILTILGVSGYFVYQRFQQQRVAVTEEMFQTTPVERANLTAAIGATGQVSPRQSAVISWQTSGNVEEVVGEVGSQVQAGQKLASLVQTSLPQNVILAQAELIAAQQALDDLEINAENARQEALSRVGTAAEQVRTAQYNLDNLTVPSNQQGLDPFQAYEVMKEKLDRARLAFEPYKYLEETNPSREDLLDKLNQAQSDFNAAVRRLQNVVSLDVAEANLDKAFSDYETYQKGPDPQDIQAAEARLAAAQATLNLASLNAPFDGTITEANVKVGDLVTPGSVAFRLDDLSSLLVDVRVPEVDINRIQVGQQVDLIFDAIPDKRYPGIVTQVAEVGTASQGVVEYLVTLELTEVDEGVRPGMTAAVNFVVTELEDVLQVPNRAVRILDGKRVVYVLVNSLPTPVEITLGASSETMSQVLGGDLKEGDLIVLNPPLEFGQNGPGGPGMFMR